MNTPFDPLSKIAVIGLGYVGLPLAVEFGSSRRTIGYDINELRIRALNSGIDSTREITSEKLLLSTQLEFSSDLEDICDCGIFIITVPTPIDKANRPDLEPLCRATETIGSVLKVGDIVIYESTVFPGCTEEVCVPILEKVSGLTFNSDFFCGYSPERINPGDKVNTITKIKKVTSGSTKEVADYIDDLYSSIITAGTYKAESIKVAEAAKVIENTQRDLNIALVNELSVIFERLEIDTSEVLRAAGSKWNFLPFNPGMVGGHCIGVDPYYLTHKAEMVGYLPQVILAGRRINDNMARYVARNIVKRMIKNGIDITKSKIGILGMTFKENCPDVRNTKVNDIIIELESWGIEVLVTDPWAHQEEVKNIYGVELVSLDKIVGVQSLIIAVGHNEYRSFSPEDLVEMVSCDRPVIADVKSIYEKKPLQEAGFTVFRL